MQHNVPHSNRLSQHIPASISIFESMIYKIIFGERSRAWVFIQNIIALNFYKNSLHLLTTQTRYSVQFDGIGGITHKYTRAHTHNEPSE